jgi:carboxylesterase
MNIVQVEAAPFFFERGRIGCLLIHGFTGAPAEMRWLGEQLAKEGYSTLGVRLFAHGTDQKDMLRAKWRDWYFSAVDGYYQLKGCCDHIFVIGLSMGGVLALMLGSDYPISGVVALSTPLSVPLKWVKPFLPLIPIVSKFWRYKSKGSPDWVDPSLQDDHFDYPVYPLIAVHELDLLMKEMRKRLNSVRLPTLIIHSKTDGSVSGEHAQRLHQLIGSDDKEIVWLENSGHVITRDVEKDRVLHEVSSFISRITLKERAESESGFLA